MHRLVSRSCNPYNRDKVRVDLTHAFESHCFALAELPLRQQFLEIRQDRNEWLGEHSYSVLYSFRLKVAVGVVPNDLVDARLCDDQCPRDLLKMGVTKRVSFECSVGLLLPLPIYQLHGANTFNGKPDVIVDCREAHVQQTWRVFNRNVLLQKFFGCNNLLKVKASF
jgi:hypothetical protein